jgi:hypothetical protein
MNLYEFINKTIGTIQQLPNGGRPGQCVSLVQQYLIQCYDIPFKARGDAKDFGTSLVSDGLAIEVQVPAKGDLIVYSATIKNKYGHVAIYVDKNKMYDQNNKTHDNLKSGYSTILKGSKKYYRIIQNEKWTSGDYELLVAKAVRKTPNCDNNKNIQIVGLLRSAKPYCTTKGFFDKAHLKVGTICKIDSIYLDSTRRVWGQFGQYWIVLCNKDGTPQARKVK